MAEPVSTPIEEKRREHERSKRSEYWRGVPYGVLPLIVVAVIISGAFALAALARQIIGVAAFPLQQSVVLIILGSGVVLALIAFTLALVFTLRRVAKWQRAGSMERAQAALWTLAASCLLILLPLLLALVLP